MKVKFSEHFPFYGFRAICLGNTIYYRIREEYRERLIAHNKELYFLIQHERTHQFQQRELLFIFFFILYALEWFLKLCTGHAYRNISFEREARACQKDPDNYDVRWEKNKDGILKTMWYDPKNEKGSLINRKHYSWTKYIFKSK